MDLWKGTSASEERAREAWRVRLEACSSTEALTTLSGVEIMKIEEAEINIVIQQRFSS